MSRRPTESWSASRIVALLAAVFAITLGSLLPYAAAAAASPDRTLVLCSSEGPQTVGGAGRGSDDRTAPGVKCAACITPAAVILPDLPQPVPAAPPALQPENRPAGAAVRPLPPARAPPRPPSTAPPHA